VNNRRAYHLPHGSYTLRDFATGRFAGFGSAATTARSANRMDALTGHSPDSHREIVICATPIFAAKAFCVSLRRRRIPRTRSAPWLRLLWRRTARFFGFGFRFTFTPPE
jgi:hypothetical protein